jgi:hypothetical protein
MQKIVSVQKLCFLSLCLAVFCLVSTISNLNYQFSLKASESTLKAFVQESNRKLTMYQSVRDTWIPFSINIGTFKSFAPKYTKYFWIVNFTVGWWINLAQSLLITFDLLDNFWLLFEQFCDKFGRINSSFRAPVLQGSFEFV